jgi:hypothetical protein
VAILQTEPSAGKPSCAAFAEQLGITVNPDGPTEQRIPCWKCAKGPRDRSLGVNISTGTFHCFRCNWSGRAFDERATRQPTISTAEKRSILSSEGLGLWQSCIPLSGVARCYLEARRCRLPPADGDLRCHNRLRHPSGYIGPALVALVTDALSGEPMTLHRTWVNANGTKPAMERPRLLLAGHQKKGGVIRLWPDEAVSHGLAVAEGIETALAAAHAFTPIWSCVDAGNMGCFPLLEGIESLTIFADHDKAGIAAAETLGQRWADVHREVCIIMPIAEGADVADVVTA